VARHEPANWARIIDDRIADTSNAAQREMLETLKKRFMSAFERDIDGFLSTFAPDFVRITHVGGSAFSSDLDDIRALAEAGAFTWPELDRLMVDGNTIAVEGHFNVILADAATCAAIGVAVDEPDAKHLLSAHAVLFLEFHDGVQARELAYAGTSPAVSRLADDDILCALSMSPAAA